MRLTQILPSRNTWERQSVKFIMEQRLTTAWKPLNFYDTPAQIVIGPIVEKTSNAFSIGKIVNGTIGNYTGPYTNLWRTEREDGGILNIATNSGTRVYGYDYGAPSRSSLFIGTTGDLLKCNFARSELLEGQTVIPWNNLHSQVDGVPAGMNIAIAKVVNGVAQDIFVYIAAE